MNGSRNVLKVILDKKVSKLSNLKKRDVMSAKPDDYIHLDWSKEFKNLHKRFSQYYSKIYESKLDKRPFDRIILRMHL